MIKGVIALLFACFMPFGIYAQAQNSGQEQKVSTQNSKSKEFLGDFADPWVTRHSNMCCNPIAVLL